MKLLLDTHAFIWWDSKAQKLSPRVLTLVQDSANNILLSTASVWEMQIKLQLGKLQLDRPLAEIIASQQEKNSIELLPVQLDHVLALQTLPTHHKDPFDRLLIAQANIEGAALVTTDPIFARYPVNILW